MPIDAGIDWTEGMGPENVEEFALALEGGPAFEEAIEAAGLFLADSSSDNVTELMGGLLSDPDKAVLNDALRRVFAESTAYGFVEGWRGFYDDDVAIFSPWGFDPTAITTPVDVFFGDFDLMVPAAHGRWLASHLPTAIAHHHAHEGHLSIIANHIEEIATAIALNSSD